MTTHNNDVYESISRLDIENGIKPLIKQDDLMKLSVIKAMGTNENSRPTELNLVLDLIRKEFSRLQEEEPERFKETLEKVEEATGLDLEEVAKEARKPIRHTATFFGFPVNVK